MLSDTSLRYLGTLQNNNRHQTTPTDVSRHPKKFFADVWRFMMTLNGVCWSLIVSFSVWCSLEMWGVSQRLSECYLWTCLRFGFIWEYIWVFRPLVQQMFFIGKAPKGKILDTWHFWNIIILKPPFVSSLKITGLLKLGSPTHLFLEVLKL